MTSTTYARIKKATRAGRFFSVVVGPAGLEPATTSLWDW